MAAWQFIQILLFFLSLINFLFSNFKIMKTIFDYIVKYIFISIEIKHKHLNKFISNKANSLIFIIIGNIV